MQPSSAILPDSTASPPSLLNAWSADRITPASRSRSRLSQRRSWLNAVCVGTPPGAARKNFCTSGSFVRAISHLLSASPSVALCTVGRCAWSSPARSSSPRIAMIPPARWTSSIWTSLFAGATFDRHGTRRDSRSMSSIVKSTPASNAAASRWSTVFVDPPMAMSRLIAFSNASNVAILRGSTLSSPSS